MKHSSHQIRGNCTYYFALEPGITFAHGRESSGSSHLSPRLRASRPKLPLSLWPRLPSEAKDAVLLNGVGVGRSQNERFG